MIQKGKEDLNFAEALLQLTTAPRSCPSRSPRRLDSETFLSLRGDLDWGLGLVLPDVIIGRFNW
jgi:hypothetical protein